MQLAHAPKNEAEGAYNNALYLRQRRIMMQTGRISLTRLAIQLKPASP
jgi:hypothetical protein